MLGVFKRKPLIQDWEASWILDVYGWLLASSGGYSEFRRSELVLPTPEFFPVSGAPGPGLAEELFALVKGYAGMGEWPCRLVQHAEVASMSEVVPNMGSYESPGGAAGTFSVSRGVDAKPVVEISYAPSLLSDPMGFVATMAHELGHYLMAGFPTPPPGGEAQHELATDICAAFMGFGVFSCNTAFRFDQFQSATSIGWSFKTQGYLSQEMLAFSLGVFLRLADDDPGPALRHLSTNPKAYLKRALKELDGNWAADIVELQAIEPEPQEASGAGASE